MQQHLDITNLEIVTLSGDVGSNHSIQVEGNITTGYNWFLDMSFYNENNVLCTNKGEHNQGEYVNPQSDGVRRLGAPGHSVFKFQLKSEGNHKVVLVYKRSWESDNYKTKILNFVSQ